MRTLGFLLAMQADSATAPAHALGGGFIDLIRQSTPLSKAVLATLVLFSIVSWGIILYKLLAFNRIRAQSSRFIEIFRRSTKFSEVQAVCQSLSDSPLVGIFLAGYADRADKARLDILLALPEPVEALDLSRDSKFLAEIARATGGSYLPLDRVAELDQHLPSGEWVSETRVVRGALDHPLAVGALLLGLLALELHLVETGAKDAKCLLLVLELAFLVLAGHHEAGRQMGEANGRVGGVDRLATRPGRAVDVHLDVVGVDVHLDLLDLGQDGDRGR